jgi:hypothetical protein
MKHPSYIKLLPLLFFIFSYSQLTFSQETKNDSLVTFYDLFKKKSKRTESNTEAKSNTILLPTIGYQPATGFTLGFISQYSFKKDLNDKISLISGGASYSTKKQILTYVKNSMYLSKDKYFLKGDYRYYIFSQSNFGLSSDIIPYGNDFDDFDFAAIEQPMKYNYFKFHQTASSMIFKSLYAGLGIHVDDYSHIKDELLDVTNQKFTYHYDYSKKYGFNENHYSIVGGSINVIYDTRDNLINTNNGLFVYLNYRFNPKINSSQQESTVLTLDSRYFIPLDSKIKQHVLGFWAYGQFNISGKVPYLNLPAIGWDQNNRSGKGYIQGLIRGAHLLCLESEYRFPVLKNQLITGTAFVNATTASDVEGNVKLFHSIQPAIGLGLRILLDKNTFTNFVANFGLGRDSKTFYFNDGESF